MSTKELDRLIRAGYPLIGIESVEEHRVKASVMDFIEDHYIAKPQYPRFKLFSWTVSRGLSSVDLSAENNGDENTVKAPTLGDPISEALGVLAFIMDYDPTDSALFLLRDFHPYIAADESGPRYPDIVRSLRDCAEALIARQQTIILLSPQLTLPHDLQGVKVINWGLPAGDLLSAQLDAFLEEQEAQSTLNGEREALVRALSGLTMGDADAILAEAYIENGVIDERAVLFVNDAKAQVIKRNKTLEYFSTDVSPSDVGGLNNLKSWLRKAGKTRTEKAQAMGIKPARGALLVGVPGCGKSLTAKMIASMWGLPLIKWNLAETRGSLVGETERKTGEALKVFDAVAPCVVWIDEIEKVLGSSGTELDGGSSTNMLAQVLSWMEESTSPVFVVATANDITALKPELIRRFTETFFVDLPSLEEREEILTIHLSKCGYSPSDYNTQEIAQDTQGYSGAELEQVIQQALWIALDQDQDLNSEHLVMAVGEVVPLSHKQADKIEAMRKWADTVRLASIPEEEKPNTTQATPQSRKIRR